MVLGGMVLAKHVRWENGLFQQQDAFLSHVEDEVDDGKVGQKSVLVAEYLVVGAWGVDGRGVYAFVFFCSLQTDL